MAGISLCMRPRAGPLTWEEFCASHGPYAMALDGYVVAGPRFDPSGPRINLDHHTEVDRLATRATCAQVLLAICQGLFVAFRDQDGPRADVHVNDCDEDVCTAWALLTHAHVMDYVVNPLLNRLVGMVDVLDTTAGAFPYPVDLPLLQELAWVFFPYRRFRLSGGLDRREVEDYVGVVTEVEQRIVRHIRGRGRRLALDTRYERVGGGPGWALIREVGAQARTGVFADGIHAYVAVREREGDRWSYTVGRMSPFIPFDVPAILLALGEAESPAEGAWGGSNIVGGSPRVEGSRLPPAEVERIINDLLRRSTAYPVTSPAAPHTAP
jgi:hypothetical protein